MYVSPRKVLTESIYITEAKIKELDRKSDKTVEDVLTMDAVIAHRLNMVQALRRYDSMHPQKKSIKIGRA